MTVTGRGNIACTPAVQQRVLHLVGHGWSVLAAARECRVSDRTVYRQARRDGRFRASLSRLIDENRRLRRRFYHRPC